MTEPKKHRPKDGDLADIAEFGYQDEDPGSSIAKLIRALPEDARAAYREQCRAFIADMCQRLDLEPCTYAEYMNGETRRKNRGTPDKAADEARERSIP